MFLIIYYITGNVFADIIYTHKHTYDINTHTHTFCLLGLTVINRFVFATKLHYAISPNNILKLI